MNNKEIGNIEITEVRIKRIDDNRRAKALASVVLNNCFKVTHIRVIEDKEKGTFISMPSYKEENGKFSDYCHPINQATREKIESAILEEYKKN